MNVTSTCMLCELTSIADEVNATNAEDPLLLMF